MQPRSRAFLSVLAVLLVSPALASAQEGPLGRAIEPVYAMFETAPAAEDADRPVARATFLHQQLAFPRVRQAYETRADDVSARFEAHDITDPAEVFFRVFKEERVLEVWARQRGVETFVRLDSYPVCQGSGELGPKREQGDRQVPEGFYTIDLFNPASNYHLSMRVDYPNAVDRARGSTSDPGGDIFIHGGCVTVGCVPVTDAGIEELYLIAVHARDAGQRSIPVHIFPTRLDEGGLAGLRDRFGAGHADYGFWQNLQEGYLAFERTRMLPQVDQRNGRYVIPKGVPVPFQLDPAPGPAPPLGRPAAF